MLRRQAVAAVLPVLLVLGCGQPVDDHVLATVGRSEVRRDYVESLLPPSGDSVVHVAGEPHPVEAAVELAVRDQLLANEAERRRLPGDTRAEQLAQLLAAERAATPTLTADSITDAEAAAWYARHRSLFDAVETARVSWGEFSEEAAARVAYLRADAGDAGSLRELSADPTQPRRFGVASIHHDGGADEMVLRITNAVRRAGGVGLDQHPENGSWYLVRVESISFERSVWTPAFAAKVKAAMAWEREQSHLSQLADRLRQEWPVQILETRVQELVNEEN